MKPDALATLLRIRRANLDDAERAVGQALAHQQSMQSRCEAEEASYAAETLAALDLANGDEAVDAFARWLPVGRKVVALARAAEQDASAEVDRTRVLLGLARAAHRSVKALIEKRNEEAAHEQERKAQHVMDDLAGRARPV
jgi:flagellar export protein FliJ